MVSGWSLIFWCRQILRGFLRSGYHENVKIAFSYFLMFVLS